MADGTMYSGSFCCSAARAAPPASSAAARVPPRTRPAACRPAPSSRASTTASRTPAVLRAAPPRSRPARCGSRAPSPDGRCGREIPACHRRASAPDRPCGTAGSRAGRTDRARSARPSAPAGAGSRAPHPRRRYGALRRRRPAPARRCVEHIELACWRWAGRSAPAGTSRPRTACAASSYDRRLRRAVEVEHRATHRDDQREPARQRRTATASPLHSTRPQGGRCLGDTSHARALHAAGRARCTPIRVAHAPNCSNIAGPSPGRDPPTSLAAGEQRPEDLPDRRCVE